MQGSFLQHYQYAIAAGEIQPVWAYNRMLTILENSASENIDVSIGGQPFTTFKKGLAYELPEEFDHLLIKNTAGTSTTIEFTLSVGRVYDNRVVLSGDIAVVDVANAIETPVAIALNAGNSYTQTIAALSTQKGLEIQNTGSNDCWYGDTNVDPATKRGVKLDVGADKILPINCDLVLKSASVDCTISYMRLKKV